LDGKTIFDHFLNAASALVGNAPESRKEAKRAPAKPAANFGFGPSCCIAKRPVGTGQLPQVRKPGSK
jgi:hypothetical protein